MASSPDFNARLAQFGGGVQRAGPGGIVQQNRAAFERAAKGQGLEPPAPPISVSLEQDEVVRWGGRTSIECPPSHLTSPLSDLAA